MSKNSATLECQNIMENRIKQGLPVYNAGLGANPLKQPQFFIEQLKKYAHKKDYTKPSGIPELNQTLINKYTNNFYKPNNVIIGNGLKELLFLIQLSFSNMTNGVIFHITPSWVSYKEQICLLGKEDKLVQVQTTLSNNYKIDLNELEEKLLENKERAKMIIFNNPNNPTGTFHTPEETEQLAMLFRKYNVIVVADEIYGNLTHFNNLKSISDYIPELTLVGSSVSKDLGCGGYRLGWLMFPSNLMDLYNNTFSAATSLYSCAATPIQYATNEMLKNEIEHNQFCYKNNKIFKSVTDDIDVILKTSKLKYIKPKSAWYIYVDFSNYSEQLEKLGISNSFDLSKYLINTIGLINVAGENFESPGLNIRFSLIDIKVKQSIVNIDHLKEGFQKLVDLISSL